MSILRMNLYNVVTFRHLVNNGATYRFILWRIQSSQPVWAVLVEDQDGLTGLLSNNNNASIPTPKEVMSVKSALYVAKKIERIPDLHLPCKPDSKYQYTDDQKEMFQEFTDNLASEYDSYQS